MAENLIVSTPKISMHALAYQGIMVYTCYPQLSDMLRRRFGDEYVLLFARPVENMADGQIDWYTPVQGKAKKLGVFPEEERNAIYARLANMGQNILRYADELINTGIPQKVTRGQVLKLALQYPDNDCLYMVGEQPVYACWGFGPGTPGVEGQYLSHIAQPAAPSSQAAPKPWPVKPAPEPAAATATRVVHPFGWRWLWWLFPFLALCLLLLLLFTSFPGLPALGGISFFHLDHWPFVTDRAGEIALLEKETRDLEKRLDSHIAMCKPTTPEPTPEKALTEEPAAQGQLVIPKNDDNLDFLEGEWLCKTGLANAETGEPVQFAFSFNRQGRGTGTVYEKNDRCSGPAVGSLSSGVLKLSLGEQQCVNSARNYGKLVIECQNVANSSTTVCNGINRDGSRWDATFYKLR